MMQTLSKFGIAYEKLSKVVKIEDKSDFYWAIEDDRCEETITVQYAINKNFIYDYDDETLSGKIVTDKDLIFRTGNVEYTAVLEKFTNKYTDQDIYIAYLFKDNRSLFQNE